MKTQVILLLLHCCGIFSVVGLECYICGTQPSPSSSEFSQGAHQRQSMSPDPCWETDVLVKPETVTCPPDHVCVKLVTYIDAEPASISVDSEETSGESVKSIQRGCTRNSMNFGLIPDRQEEHRIGCGPLRSMSTDNSYENEVACFCSTDYCNHGNRQSSTFSHRITILFVAFKTLACLLYNNQ